MDAIVQEAGPAAFRKRLAPALESESTHKNGEGESISSNANFLSLTVFLLEDSILLAPTILSSTDPSKDDTFTIVLTKSENKRSQEKYANDGVSVNSKW